MTRKKASKTSTGRATKKRVTVTRKKVAKACT